MIWSSLVSIILAMNIRKLYFSLVFLVLHNIRRYSTKRLLAKFMKTFVDNGAEF